MTQEIRRVEVPEEFSSAVISDETVIVVLDVYMFSTTVITIHNVGVDNVIPVYNEEELETYREQDILIGGEDGKGIDFSNSPQNVYAKFGMMESPPETVAFTSHNGAKRCVEAVEAIRSDNLNSCEVLIGSSVNASAIAEYIKEEFPTHNIVLLCAGSHGEATIEDVIGSLAISQEIRDEDIPTEEYEEILSLLPSGIDDIENIPWLTEEDVHHVSTLSNFDIVPKYDFQNDWFTPAK